LSTLLIATNNLGKQEEIISIVAEMNFHIATPMEIGLRLDIEENGKTYKENAAKKAIGFAQNSGLFALADDTGLEVDALGGEPGLCSARYVPRVDATDADRRSYLLENLKTKTQPWYARFICVVAIATPEGKVSFSEGICNGKIIPNERGGFGFGYDPIFQISIIGKTMAELTMQQKNEISHRAIAVKAAFPVLKKWLSA
jgi:XTP/dITP diphosphohydrolase